jgi:hypothetical protein
MFPNNLKQIGKSRKMFAHLSGSSRPTIPIMKRLIDFPNMTNTNLVVCIKPFYYLFKLFGLNSFVYDKYNIPQKSNIGSLYSLVVCMIYFTYHMYVILHLQHEVQSSETNIVALIINNFNSFYGCFFILFLTLASIGHQKKIVKVVKIFYRVDSLLDKQFQFKVDNWMWKR